nr:hypothetical protein [Tanacetum cinerariifolium]
GDLDQRRPGSDSTARARRHPAPLERGRGEGSRRPRGAARRKRAELAQGAPAGQRGDRRRVPAGQLSRRAG